MKKIIYLLMLLHTLAAFSQKHGNIWYFGYKVGLDFNGGAPVSITDGAIFTNEGTSVMSDAQGNLMFYTDGVKVWNKNHQVMENGTGLMGSFTSAQSALIVPKPGFNNIYYIFAVYLQGFGGLTYSEVDMEANGGLGKVTDVKNVVLVASTTEQLTGVVHQNGTDIWVIAHGYGNATFYSFLVTTEGVTTTPVTTNAGPSIPLGPGESFEGIGNIKASPDGSKIAMVNYESGSRLYDFNNATGILSNMLTLEEGHTFYYDYGVEFSPYGNLLYISKETDGAIVQYNLMEEDIVASATTVYQNPEMGIGALQLAPDGKIYFVTINGNTVHAINSPGTPGIACNAQANAVDVTGTTTYLGLPNFIQSYFMPSIQAQNFCLGSPTQFSVGPGTPPDTAIWDFGDGGTSQQGAPEHKYAAPGTYNISATVSFMGKVMTFHKVITIFEPQFSLGGPYTACNAPGITLSAQPLNFTPDGAAYLWEFNGATVGTDATLHPQEFGTYSLTVTVNGCSTTHAVDVVQQTISATYTQGCEGNHYTLAALPQEGSFDAQTAQYSWTGPGGFSHDGQQAIISEPGNYMLTITTPAGCTLEHTWTVDDANCADPFIPKGVSPDGDGKNDVFDLTGVDVAQLAIYNRYGLEVFSYGHYTTQWHGQTNSGDILPDGTYYYHILKHNGVNVTGWVYVNRQGN